jgi:RNA polymerase sigma factor (sigma-70 family)
MVGPATLTEEPDLTGSTATWDDTGVERVDVEVERVDIGSVDPTHVAGRGSVAEQLAAVEPMVRGICRARLGAADGDDAAQRTMLTLWRRLEAGDRAPIESLPGYAAVCARYEVLSSLGEFGRRPTVAIGEAAQWACVDDAPGPEAQALRAAEQAEAAARVEELLAALTPRQAEVLRATKLADTDVDTDVAARELGINASSVRSTQVRAMARLRELCGTRSPNPLASRVPLAERRKAAWAASWARRSARAAEHRAHPSPAQAEFAEDLRRQRLDRGLSQSQLAAALGCDGSYVSKVERGLTWPSREFARRVDQAWDTGEAFQGYHDRHRARTAAAAAGSPVTPADAFGTAGAPPRMSRSTDTDTDTDTAVVASDRVGDRETVDDAPVDDAAVDGDAAPRGCTAAACAEAHAAVQAAVARVEAGPRGEVDAVDDEQARAAQLARWHADDQETAATDSTADTDGEWAWSA